MEDITYNEKKILACIRKNAKLSAVRVAEITQLHVNTVLKTISDLKKRGIIINKICEVDYGKIGYIFHAMIFIRHAEYNENKMRKIASLYNIAEMYVTGGNFDIIASTRARSRQELEETMHQIETIFPGAETEIDLILETKKRYSEFNPFLNEINSDAVSKSINAKIRQDRSNNDANNSNRRTTKIKDIDLKILAMLRENANIPLRQMARKLRKHMTTIKYRVKKLEENRIILSYYANIDFERVGYVYAIITLYKTKRGYENTIIKGLEKNPKVTTLYLTTGEYRLLSIVRVKTRDEIKEYLKEVRQMPGVEETNTNLIIDIFKTHSEYNPLAYLIK